MAAEQDEELVVCCGWHLGMKVKSVLHSDPAARTDAKYLHHQHRTHISLVLTVLDDPKELGRLDEHSMLSDGRLKGLCDS